MDNLIKNRQVNFKTNADLLEQAKTVFARKNIDLSVAFNTVLKTVVETNDFPFVTEEDQIRQAIIDEIQPKIQKAVADYHSGKGIPLDEVMAKYEL